MLITFWILLSFYYDEIKHYFRMLEIQEAIKRTEPLINKKYSSVEELVQEYEANTALLKHIYCYLKAKIELFIEFPRNLYLDLEAFFQRGFRGWANRDTWGYDFYLSNLIVQGVKYLKQTKNGYSVEFNSPEEFNKALDEIVWTFKTYKNIANGELRYKKSSSWTSKYYYEENIRCKQINKKCGANDKVMNLEECKRYEKGWKLFQKSFMSLWD
jgi:hypothetical protein